MLTAAKEGTFSPSSDPCVFFPLAASEGVPKNSRLGFARKNPAPHQGSAWSNSGKALGIEEVVWEICGGSDDSARYYDPQSGRFMSEDPLRFFAGNISFYGYAEQNPANFIDPLGLFCKCTYSQATGHLKCVDSGTGNTVAEGNGYAGNGAGKNNPDMQGVPFVGPLPRGNYNIGPTRNSPNTGPISIVLTYTGGTEPFPANRSPDMFRIHGDSKSDPGNASQGCIVIDPNTRKAISQNCGAGSTLAVGP